MKRTARLRWDEESVTVGRMIHSGRVRPVEGTTGFAPLSWSCVIGTVLMLVAAGCGAGASSPDGDAPASARATTGANETSPAPLPGCVGTAGLPDGPNESTDSWCVDGVSTAAWDEGRCYGVQAEELSPNFNSGCASIRVNDDGTCTMETTTDPPHVVACEGFGSP